MGSISGIIMLISMVSALIGFGSMILINPRKYFFGFSEKEVIPLCEKENVFEMLVYNTKKDCYENKG